MKQYFTSTFRKSAIIVFIIGLFSGIDLNAQVNVALTATAVNGPAGGTGGCPGLAGYGPCYYNDGIIPVYTTSGPGTWSNVNSVNNAGADSWIKFYWPVGTGPSSGTVNKVVFYKESRPMLKCSIQYWNVGTGQWVTHATYQNFSNSIADSIIFPAIPVSTDSIRIFGINAGYVNTLINNPNFREIQIWTTPNCSGTPIPVIQAQVNGSIVATPVTGVCPGKIVSLGDKEAFFSYGHGFQWQYANAAVGPWTSIPGATNAGIDVNAYNTVYYRVVDTCTSSGLYAASAAVQVSSSVLTYASVPYFQGFDSWVTACASAPFARDVPSLEWSNCPPSGMNTWRIDSTSTFTSGWNNNSNLYFPVSIPNPSGSHSARSHSSVGLAPGSVANLDLHVDLSTPAGGKALYFYMINQLLPAASGVRGTDSLRVLISSDNGVTWTKLGSWDTAADWRRRVIPLNSTAPNAIIRFQTTSSINLMSIADQSDIGIDSVYIAGPCIGTPNAGVLNFASPITTCPDSSFSFTPIGVTMAGGLTYTWEQSTNGCVTYGPAALCSSPNSGFYYSTPALLDTICYRLKVACNSNVAYTSPVQFYVPEPQYASLPFVENFESWMTKCVSNSSYSFESPSYYWVNFPTIGNNSWRRNDQGANGNWSSPTNGTIPGNAPQGGYYARFHSSTMIAGSIGKLDLFVDCSGSVGNKELQFLYNNTSGPDSLKIFMSIDGGCTFSLITTFGPDPNGWVNKIVSIPSNAPKTIIRFQSIYDPTQTDIGIDQMLVMPPCNGTPNPGILTNANPCPGAAFTVNLLNYTSAGSLTFQWEQSTSASGPWTTIAGATNTSYSTNTVFSDVYYRVKVSCLNSGQFAYSPIQLVTIANFYYCYCTSNAVTNTGVDIGMFKVNHLPSNAVITSVGSQYPILNNPAAIASYTDYRFPITPLIPFYHDSTYKLSVFQTNGGAFSPSTCSIWLDMNRNGVFEQAERIFKKNTSQVSIPLGEVDTTFFVSDTIPVGITGLRIVLENPTNNNSLPCAQYGYGETEDYLVEIRYPPCDGPTNAGIAYAPDSLSCPGYTMTFVDTTHEHKRHNIIWNWEYSPDGNSWAVVPNSIKKDSVTLTINGPTYARLRMICVKQFIIDTTYSNVVNIAINPPYACYCFSLANGGTMDTSDLGSFMIGVDTFSVYPQGPHLFNGEAIQSHTDNTKDTIVLWTHTTYAVAFYHIMNSGHHGDAKITVFMDFNNDLQYNITPTYNERVYTGYTTATNFFLHDYITIPPYAIPNIKTGMRVILNNDTGPNVQSDSACGPYSSGETEDYVVYFMDTTLGIDPLSNITQAYVYPNPTEGQFMLYFNAVKPVNDAYITAYNLMGQQILEEHFAQPGKEFKHAFDLSSMPKGVYIVELRADDEKIVRRIIIQ